MNKFYEIISEPNELPVTLQELKDYLRITSADEDSVLTAILKSSVTLAEAYTGRWFISRMARGSYPYPYISKFEPCCFVQIDRSPLQSVELVETFDGSNFIPFTDYKISFSDSYSRITSDTFNVLRADCTPFLIRVEFTAGYGDASMVPDQIKEAINNIAAGLYQSRGDCCEGSSIISSVSRSFLDSYRIISVFA